MSVYRKRLKWTSVAVALTDIESAAAYIRDKTLIAHQDASFELTLSKNDDEDFETSEIGEFSKELQDIRDLAQIKSLEVHAYSYADDFSAKLTLETRASAITSVSLNLRSGNSDLIYAMANEVPKRLNFEQTGNKFLTGLRGIALATVIGLILSYVGLALLSTPPLYYAIAPPVVTLLVLFVQAKLEKIYPNLLLIGASGVRANGRRFVQDIKGLWKWLALLILGGVILVLFKLN